jgi:hypothetical protein
MRMRIALRIAVRQLGRPEQVVAQLRTPGQFARQNADVDQIDAVTEQMHGGWRVNNCGVGAGGYTLPRLLPRRQLGELAL